MSQPDAIMTRTGNAIGLSRRGEPDAARSLF
jgi:hypothetical protein